MRMPRMSARVRVIVPGYCAISVHGESMLRENIMHSDQPWLCGMINLNIRIQAVNLSLSNNSGECEFVELPGQPNRIDN